LVIDFRFFFFQKACMYRELIGTYLIVHVFNLIVNTFRWDYPFCIFEYHTKSKITLFFLSILMVNFFNKYQAVQLTMICFELIFNFTSTAKEYMLFF